MDVLLTIQEKQIVRPSRIASLSNINYQKAQKILSQLIEAGFVVEAENPKNGRKVYSLTDDGEQNIEYLEGIAEMMAGGSAGGDRR